MSDREINRLLASLFNLKSTSKTLKKDAAKFDRESRAAQALVKKALTTNPPQPEIARLHAETAVEKSKERIKYLTLAARIDTVAARVQTATRMRNITKSMAQTVFGMEAMLKTANPEITTAVMEKFGSQLEELDVVSMSLEAATGSLQSQQIGVEGQSEVDALMMRVADEAGVELSQGLEEGQVPNEELAQGVKEGKQKDLEDRLGDRLRALRN